MNFKQFNLIMITTTVVAWLLWVFVVLTVDPVHARFLEIVAFYITFFIAAVGTLSIASIFVRKKLHPHQVIFRHVGVSFRQGLLFGILITGSLFLLSQNLLTWWLGLIFILVLGLIEFFFQSAQIKRFND